MRQFAPQTLMAVMLMAAAPAHAALSGYYDSAAQIALVLAEPKLAESLHQLPVTAISALPAQEGAPRWSISTKDCTLTVTLRQDPSATPMGPARYSVAEISACQ